MLRFFMKIGIVSGYFNPIHGGHIHLISGAKKMCDKLIIIVNNDEQQILKKGKIIMNENERVEVVSALRDVAEVFLSIDTDKTVIESLRSIGKKYPNDELIFCNGGDRNTTEEIPESIACNEYGIKLEFGVGENFKFNSSSNINKLSLKHL